jgi:GNAT superfamily N-acetyltransferase
MPDTRQDEPCLLIRQAVPADAGVLTDIAHAAKRHWGYPEKWIALWRPGLTVTAGDLVANEVFVGVCGERSAGFYALGQRNETWELKHFWMLPEYMGRGFGRALFGHAIERLQHVAPGAALEVESDPNAEAFYLHMGCERIGEVRTDWQGLTRTLPLLRLNR